MKPYYEDGSATIYCGDCRVVEEWLAADVLVMDPPYGMAYLSGRRSGPRVINDRDQGVRDAALKLWGGRPAVVFGTWKQPRPAGVRQLIVWDKRGGAGFSGDLAMPWADVCEEVYLIGDGWVGRRRPNIVSIPTVPSMATERPDHPTPKPVGIVEQLLDCCPIGVVADPFMGSGTTLIAAKNLGRQSIGIEIEERYCEIAAKRLQQEVLALTEPVEEPYASNEFIAGAG